MSLLLHSAIDVERWRRIESVLDVALELAAALLRAALAGVVHDDLAHRDGRDGEEVLPVLPVELAAIEQPQVGLVDEGRGVERHVAGARREAAMRHGVQLDVDERQQGLDRAALAAAQIAQDLGDVVPRHAGGLLSE